MRYEFLGFNYVSLTTCSNISATISIVTYLPTKTLFCIMYLYIDFVYDIYGVSTDFLYEVKDFCYRTVSVPSHGKKT